MIATARQAGGTGTRKRGKPPAPIAVQAVEPDKLYMLDAFMRLTGLKEGALRSARANGLPVHYLHNRGFIIGKEFLDYIRAKGKTSPQ